MVLLIPSCFQRTYPQLGMLVTEIINYIPQGECISFLQQRIACITISILQLTEVKIAKKVEMAVLSETDTTRCYQHRIPFLMYPFLCLTIFPDTFPILTQWLFPRTDLSPPSCDMLSCIKSCFS